MQLSENKKTLKISIIISLLIGAIIFISVYGIYVINPFYTDWIMREYTDVTQADIGWNLYRQAPWTFPIGRYDTLSYPVTNTIQNTDSIPLLAIFFKILSPILPEKFQYMGLWGFLSFMLQSLFGMLIARKYANPSITGEIIAIMGGTLFTLLPILFLLLFWHTVFSAIWLILLALIPFVYYDELNFKTRTIIYSFLGILTGTIQPYFAAMICIIVFWFSVFDFLYSKNKKALLLPFIYIISVAFIFYITEGFMSGVNLSGEYLFDNGFNLNGFFNNYGFFTILPMLPFKWPQVIGFAYFGVGLLFIIIVAFFMFLFNIKSLNKIKKIDKYKLICCLAVLITSIIIALSPRVTFGKHILFEWPLPDFIINIWSMFRSTGRFIFIANNVILALSISYLIIKLNWKILIPLLTFSIILQVYDIYDFCLNDKHKVFATKYKYKSMINKDFLNNIIKNNEIKVLYTSSNFQKLCEIYDKDDHISQMKIQYNLGIWLYETKSDLKMNNYYFSRKIKDYEKRYLSEIKNPKNTDLFIFSKKEIAKDDFLKDSGINYFYIIDEHIIAGSKNQLKGINQENELPKKQFLEQYKI